MVTANTYTHVMSDETEFDYAELLERVRDDRVVLSPVLPPAGGNGR